MGKGFLYVLSGLQTAVLWLLLASSISLAAPPTAQWRAQLALAQADKDPDASAELARRILTVDPRDNGVWKVLIASEIQSEDYDRALAALNAWEKRARPRTAAINDLRGDIYLAQDQLADAERAWRAALGISPKDYLVLSKLADLLESQERWTESLPLRTRATAAKPAAALLAAKAGALLHLHKWDAANAAIQKANAIDASDQTVQQWLPRLELLSKSLPEIKALDAQIAAHPKDAAPLLDEAVIFSQIGEASLALSNAKRALALDSGSTRARIQAGEAQLDLGHPELAAKSKVSSNLARASNGHVSPSILGELGARDAAVAQNPRDAAQLAARSATLRGLNQFVLALDDARVALNLDPDSADAQFEMARDLYGLGRPGQALASIARATALRPGDPDAWYYRGLIEASRADFKAAIDSQTRSLAIRESPAALAARRDCELRLGLNSQAAADSLRLHQIDPAASQ